MAASDDFPTGQHWRVWVGQVVDHVRSQEQARMIMADILRTMADMEAECLTVAAFLHYAAMIDLRRELNAACPCRSEQATVIT